jgi:hypothetical protein
LVTVPFVDGLLPSLDRVDGTAAVFVAGAGVLTVALGWGVGSRILRVCGLVVAATGGGLYARAKLAERSKKIDAAESDIRSTLDNLDPIARAQILKDIVIDP